MVLFVKPEYISLGKYQVFGNTSGITMHWQENVLCMLPGDFNSPVRVSL